MAELVDEKAAEPMVEGTRSTVASVIEGREVNASGHRDQLQRQYSIWSICGLALTIDNAWVALGGSIVVAVSTTPHQPPPPPFFSPPKQLLQVVLDIPQLLTFLQVMVARRASYTNI
jgi:hypothetical protein